MLIFFNSGGDISQAIKMPRISLRNLSPIYCQGIYNVKYICFPSLDCAIIKTFSRKSFN